VASWPELRLTSLLGRLSGAKVDYVVVGGIAVAFQGYGRATKDLDITYATDPGNLQRLGDVLVAMHARLRGIAGDVGFVPDGRTLRRTQVLTLDTDDGALDLWVAPPGAPPYTALRAAADAVELDGVEIRIASLDHVIAMKRAAGRPQDLIDVEALEIARGLRGSARPTQPRGPGRPRERPR
jgi:predicted nucleotidyltransferase